MLELFQVDYWKTRKQNRLQLHLHEIKSACLMLYLKLYYLLQFLQL